MACSGTGAETPCRLEDVLEAILALSERVSVLERQEARRRTPEETLTSLNAKWEREVDRAVRRFRRGPHYEFVPPTLRDVA